MRTTPRSFYDLFVRPNFWDYKESPDDARLGFNASVSAFQLADIFYAYYGRHSPAKVAKWPEKRQLLVHLRAIEPCFATIQSVATVYKHLYAKGGHYVVGTPGAVWGVSIPGEKIKLKSEWKRDAPEDEVTSDVWVNHHSVGKSRHPPEKMALFHPKVKFAQLQLARKLRWPLTTIMMPGSGW